MAITRPSLDFAREGGSRDGSSPNETFAVDDSTADRIVRVPWTQRFDAVTHFLGYSRFAEGGGSITHLERLTPLPHPDLPGMMYVARTGSIEGWKFAGKRSAADGTVGNTFTKAHVPLMYEHVPFAVKEDYDSADSNRISSATAESERFTYISNVQPSADYLSLPTGALCYIADGGTPSPPHNLPIGFGIGKIVPLTAIDVKWVNLPYQIYGFNGPWERRIWGDGSTPGLLGTINQTEIFGWAPGTVLLENVTPEIRKHPTIGLSWDVTFRFVRNVNGNGNGWNHLYYFGTDTASAANNGWYFIGKKGSAFAAPGSVPDDTSIYNEKNLNDCFNVTGAV